MIDTFWTATRESRLAEILGAGGSARVAALEFGITRNAVIGKAYRLGLGAPRARPATFTDTMLALRTHQCRWLYGDVGDATARFCEENATRLGSAWCEEHRAKVYFEMRDGKPVYPPPVEATA